VLITLVPTVIACRFQLQLSKEQKLATECDTNTPFNGHKDILRRLAVFHVFQTRDDDPERVEKGDYQLQIVYLLTVNIPSVSNWSSIQLYIHIRENSIVCLFVYCSKNWIKHYKSRPIH